MEKRQRDRGLSFHFHPVLILAAVLILASIAATNAQISINCGSSDSLRAPKGREWLGELRPEFFTIEGLSTAVSCKDDLDLVPYSTSRVSFSQFSYRFRLNPGEKLIRLHFSTACKGLHYFTDLFTVKAGPFTLLNNFSASIAAHALGLDSVVREFVLTVEDHQVFDITFTPIQGATKDAYAFVNGIEILSVPSGLSYCQTMVQIVGQKDMVHIDKGTALEIVRRVDMKLDDATPDHVDDTVRIWERSLKQKGGIKVEKNMTWKTSVDVGLSYLVRFQFCEIGLKIAKTEEKDFLVAIDGVIVSTATDLMQSSEEEGFLWHKNYIVMLNEHKREGKRDIVISFNFEHGLADGSSLLDGFEMFKIINVDDRLAGTRPVLDSPLNAIGTLFLFICSRNASANAFVLLIFVVNIIVYLLRRFLGKKFIEEEKENKPSERAKRLFRLFSLDEILSSTDNFHDRFLIGKGGFGKVYKGTIDNGTETVAFKRLKVNSKQGKREFWTEIETLSELRHRNLVSLIGYCKEKREMILVYEYMPSGSLADHLYKLPRKNKASSTLFWTQRLNICIGAARGLDYLHTGHGMVHCDIKAANILLDDHHLAKVSDFGLAEFESGKVLQSQASKHVKGTFGYMDPDYFRTRVLTTNSDTYSFGVMLLEVLCGRPALEPLAEEDKRSLTMWAQSKIHKGELESIVDPIIKKEILPDSLMTFIGITEKCLLDDPKKRPAIAYVIINLELSLEQQGYVKSLVRNQITSITDFLPASTTYSSLRSGTNPMIEQFKRKMILDGKKHGKKAALHKLARILPFDAIWNTVKQSKKNHALSVSAPVSRGTGNVEFHGGNILSNEEFASIRSLRVFSFLELKKATENFKTSLGRGGFGTVYKGWLKGNLSDGIINRYPIAVKWLSSDSQQGIEQWKNEMLFLANVSHPNVIKLLGYCFEHKKLLLVYEFMELGSLDRHLFQWDSVTPRLSWDTRLRILIGVARGLAFLHSVHIVWRDGKTSNILLDEMLNPKLSDFGLAKYGPMGTDTHDTTRVMGTICFIAPEYISTGHLSFKSDVYGFGVVMLEMLTGSRACDITRMDWNDSVEGINPLVEILNPFFGEKVDLNKIMDRRLEGIYSANAAYEFALLAKTCLCHDPKVRPEMQQVVESLIGIRSNSDEEKFE